MIVSLKPRIVVGKSETQANWDALPHLPAYIGVGETLEVGFLIDNTKFDKYIYITRLTLTPSPNIDWVGYKFEGKFYAPVNNTIDLTKEPFWSPMIGPGETSEEQIKVTCLAPGPATLTLMVDYMYREQVNDVWVEVEDATDPCTGTTTQVKVDIDADIDRDGIVEDEADEPNEESVGAVVIRDENNVYTDPDEPAKRREIVARRGITPEVRVKRSSVNLKLFRNRKPTKDEVELFGNKDEIALKPDSYWLQGGDKASTKTRDEYLKAREDDDFVCVDKFQTALIKLVGPPQTKGILTKLEIKPQDADILKPTIPPEGLTIAVESPIKTTIWGRFSSAGLNKTTLKATAKVDDTTCYEEENFTVVKVTFDKTEVRPGVPDVRNDKVTATIEPGDVTINFDVRGQEPEVADVTPKASDGKAKVELTVDGKKLSANNQITKLWALVHDAPCAEIPITVVEPHDYSSDKKELVADTPVIRSRYYEFPDGTFYYRYEVGWEIENRIKILDKWGVKLVDEVWDDLKIQNFFDGRLKKVHSIKNGTITEWIWKSYHYEDHKSEAGKEKANEILKGIIDCTLEVPEWSDEYEQILKAILDDGTIKQLNGPNKRTLVLKNKIFTVTNSH